MASDRIYRIAGTAQTTAGPQATQVGITNPRRVVPGVGRDAGVADLEARGDELVRVTLGNGFVLWTRADDLLRERGQETRSRGGEGVWRIDTSPPDRAQARGGTRGWLGLGIQVLEFFGVDLQGQTAAKLGDVLELKQLKDGPPGLYRCTLGDELILTAISEPAVIPADQGPCLVFLHGTGSSCRGSFGALWAADNGPGRATREALRRRYGDRVYAWEHRSLTQSPITNAVELVRRLDTGVDLHLVSHSRGGLVGELLCLGERDGASDPLKPGLADALFAADRTVGEQLGLSPLDDAGAQSRDKAYAADRGHLDELLALLAERRPRIRRFVRAACPTRGTTLASGRLDRWLSVLDHLGGFGLAGDAMDFLLAVVKERTDPRTLPGLEAMMPGSALTRLLQHPDLVTASDLTVISGDCEGDTLWGRLKLLATDWFYGADHDLVVNTGSMFGGIRRPERGARFKRDQGPDVNHFNYFKNDRSVRWLLQGLERVDGSDAGFLPLAEAPQEAPRWREAVRRSRGTGRPKPLAVILPGTMGSSLRVDGREVWLNYWQLLRGGLDRVRLGRPAEIEPSGLLDAFYGPLIEYLAGSHRIEVFPYDWRLSVRDAAARLATRLEDWLLEAERQGQPVRLVAHSMGGLVVRAMINDGGRGAALWRRILALPESRLMMLGTPNQGSYETLRWLTGNSPTLAKLSLLDLTQGREGIIDIVRGFPGLLELLPCAAEDPDFSRPEFWQDLKQGLKAAWNTAEAQALRQARETWAQLRQAQPDPRYMVYVAGCQPATVTGYSLEPYEESYLAGRRRLSFLATAEGDGTVTWSSGSLPQVPVWYARDTAHDALCSNRALFPGYLDLLTTGQTSRLPQTPPARSRDAAGETFPLPDTPPLDAIPDAAALALAGFGPGAPMDDQGPAAPVIRVNIRHGNLAYARHPVLVGHYLDDTIVNAERALDERLGGALSRRQQLGLYPGRPGSHALFFHDRPEGKPAGAMVIGLGQVGQLSPSQIEAGVRDGLLAYALHIAQWPDGRFGPPGKLRSAALSCLLVGSGAGGGTVSDSVEAILRGALAAAGRLAEAGLDDRVVVDRIEFLELYQDIAISAAGALERVLADSTLAAQVHWPSRVIDAGEGGLRRLGCQTASDWWQRLEILEEAEGSALRFIASTDRARAEVTLATGQLRLADGFISQAMGSAAANTEVSKTLFEMLLPTRLREFAPRQDDLVVLVDETSARFPWELLEDRWSSNGRPPAVASGMVRQLKTETFRPTPAHASGPKALVVGNPDLGGWDAFADLPGAREEATLVARVLREAGYQVRDCIDEKADAILNGLHRDGWRILHLAGHGEHEFPVPAVHAGACDACGGTPPVRQELRSGMVIGRDTLLTPGDVEQMRWVPELVFINCCHLGRTQSRVPARHNALAANLAVQFVRMGVKAVVAAGWAVDDGAANAFAESFYARMLTGEPFGEAVRAAREEVWTRFPGVNTWGAYQCYGDPSYRLSGGAQHQARPRERHYHAPCELVAQLDNHAESIRMQVRTGDEDEAALTTLREGIEDLFAGIPIELREDWRKRADVAAAAGFAWGETRAYAQAVEWLETALRANVGDCPLRALEQCNNFRVRLVGERWQALRGEPAGPDREARRLKLVDCIEDSISELAQVCERAPTLERLTLLGNACRRLAWLQDGERERLEALVNMDGYLGQAIALAGGCDPRRYPHWAGARLLAARIDPSRCGAWQDGIADECRRMSDLAAACNAEGPNLRDAVAEADNLVAQLLTQADAGEGQGDAIIERYRAALRRGASPREVAAVQEGLDFLIALGACLPGPIAAVIANVRAAL